MPKILYLECTSGVSGDMLLSAISEAGESFGAGFAKLQEFINSLQLEGVKIICNNKIISSIKTRYIKIKQSVEHPLRYLNDIKKIINNFDIPQTLKNKTIETFYLLGKAEAFVHGTKIENIHFHEIGAVDTIIDIIGVHYLLELLKIEKIVISPINVGAGFVKIVHGIVPVPAPATAELAKNLEIFATSNLCMETATPTGLAIIQSILNEQGLMPKGILESIGYGSGSKSSVEMPTILRAFLFR